MTRSIARTAGFNAAGTAAAGLGGIIVARVVGPTVRGEYAAVMAWFGVAQMIGGMGQPAALCFYISRDPARARGYVATSRAMMLATGSLALTAGLLLAPLLAHGRPGVETSYRIAFGASLISFVAASYTFSLQARDISLWNMARLSQPLLGFVAVLGLWQLGMLTLQTALFAVLVTMLAQLLSAYICCRKVGLAHGRPQLTLVRPLATYGLAQIAALAPASVNAQLDQLVLSQAVPPADLGRYAIAVSLTLLPVPFVAAIGNVAFPRLAAQREPSEKSRQLERSAVLGSVGLAAAMLVPLALVAHWLVPLVFGTAYQSAVPLVWILTPGGIFLASGQVVGDLLRGRNRPVFVAWAQGLAAVFTVVMLIALLPLLGVYAAAIASTVAYGIAFIVMVRYLWQAPVASKHAEPGTPKFESVAPEQ